MSVESHHSSDRNDPPSSPPPSSIQSDPFDVPPGVPYDPSNAASEHSSSDTATGPNAEGGEQGDLGTRVWKRLTGTFLPFRSNTPTSASVKKSKVDSTDAPHDAGSSGEQVDGGGGPSRSRGVTDDPALVPLPPASPSPPPTPFTTSSLQTAVKEEKKVSLKDKYAIDPDKLALFERSKERMLSQQRALAFGQPQEDDLTTKESPEPTAEKPSNVPSPSPVTSPTILTPKNPPTAPVVPPTPSAEANTPQQANNTISPKNSATSVSGKTSTSSPPPASVVSEHSVAPSSTSSESRTRRTHGGPIDPVNDPLRKARARALESLAGSLKAKEEAKKLAALSAGTEAVSSPEKKETAASREKGDKEVKKSETSIDRDEGENDAKTPKEASTCVTKDQTSSSREDFPKDDLLIAGEAWPLPFISPPPSIKECPDKLFPDSDSIHSSSRKEATSVRAPTDKAKDRDKVVASLDIDSYPDAHPTLFTPDVRKKPKADTERDQEVFYDSVEDIVQQLNARGTGGSQGSDVSPSASKTGIVKSSDGEKTKSRMLAERDDLDGLRYVEERLNQSRMLGPDDSFEGGERRDKGSSSKPPTHLGGDGDDGLRDGTLTPMPEEPYKPARPGEAIVPQGSANFGLLEGFVSRHNYQTIAKKYFVPTRKETPSGYRYDHAHHSLEDILWAYHAGRISSARVYRDLVSLQHVYRDGKQDYMTVLSPALTEATESISSRAESDYGSIVRPRDLHRRDSQETIKSGRRPEASVTSRSEAISLTSLGSATSAGDIIDRKAKDRQIHPAAPVKRRTRKSSLTQEALDALNPPSRKDVEAWRLNSGIVSLGHKPQDVSQPTNSVQSNEVHPGDLIERPASVPPRLKVKEGVPDSAKHTGRTTLDALEVPTGAVTPGASSSSLTARPPDRTTTVAPVLTPSKTVEDASKPVRQPEKSPAAKTSPFKWPSRRHPETWPAATPEGISTDKTPVASRSEMKTAERLLTAFNGALPGGPLHGPLAKSHDYPVSSHTEPKPLSPEEKVLRKEARKRGESFELGLHPQDTKAVKRDRLWAGKADFEAKRNQLHDKFEGPSSQADKLNALNQLSELYSGLGFHEYLDYVNNLYKDFLRSNPENPKAWIQYAESLLKANKLEEAGSIIQRATEIFQEGKNDKHPELWFTFGRVMRHRGMFDAADLGYDRCLLLQPKHTLAVMAAYERGLNLEKFSPPRWAQARNLHKQALNAFDTWTAVAASGLPPVGKGPTECTPRSEIVKAFERANERAGEEVDVHDIYAVRKPTDAKEADKDDKGSLTPIGMTSQDKQNSTTPLGTPPVPPPTTPRDTVTPTLPPATQTLTSEKQKETEVPLIASSALTPPISSAEPTPNSKSAPRVSMTLEDVKSWSPRPFVPSPKAESKSDIDTSPQAVPLPSGSSTPSATDPSSLQSRSTTIVTPPTAITPTNDSYRINAASEAREIDIPSEAQEIKVTSEPKEINVASEAKELVRLPLTSANLEDKAVQTRKTMRNVTVQVGASLKKKGRKRANDIGVQVTPIVSEEPRPSPIRNHYHSRSYLPDVVSALQKLKTANDKWLIDTNDVARATNRVVETIGDLNHVFERNSNEDEGHQNVAVNAMKELTAELRELPFRLAAVAALSSRRPQRPGAEIENPVESVIQLLEQLKSKMVSDIGEAPVPAVPTHDVRS